MREEIKVMLFAGLILAVSVAAHDLTSRDTATSPSGETAREATVSWEDKTGKVVYDPNNISAEILVKPRLIQSYQGKIVNDRPLQ